MVGTQVGCVTININLTNLYSTFYSLLCTFDPLAVVMVVVLEIEMVILDKYNAARLGSNVAVDRTSSRSVSDHCVTIYTLSFNFAIKTLR